MALKDIVTLAQSRATGQSDTMSSRARSMTKHLNNLKNNKIKKTVATQHLGGDAVERMKKFLSELEKEARYAVHAVLAHEPLRVSLEDLHSPREVPQHSGEQETDDVSTAALLKLARKQGMNTDIFRVFVVLMSSDVDTCERLAQLGLTEVQQHEIIRVNLHCRGNVPSFSAFAFVQGHVWDFLRDLGESSVGGVEVIKSLKDNDVSFDVKPMSPLRMKNPVDFTMLKSQTHNFLKELFIQLFVASQVSSPMLGNDSGDYSSSFEEIFLEASRIENLGLGLVFFMSNMFKGENGFLTWASSVAKETLQTGMEHIPRI
ncbi:hypothetical protein BD769DRAFT_1457798 [Suillus cothurnatus]|nr:hypothetical protein BD769DRAFT_1457798 [Suillus cothurnatus]